MPNPVHDEAAVLEKHRAAIKPKFLEAPSEFAFA